MKNFTILYDSCSLSGTICEKGGKVRSSGNIKGPVGLNHCIRDITDEGSGSYLCLDLRMKKDQSRVHGHRELAADKPFLFRLTSS